MQAPCAAGIALVVAVAGDGVQIVLDHGQSMCRSLCAVPRRADSPSLVGSATDCLPLLSQVLPDPDQQPATGWRSQKEQSHRVSCPPCSQSALRHSGCLWRRVPSGPAPGLVQARLVSSRHSRRPSTERSRAKRSLWRRARGPIPQPPNSRICCPCATTLQADRLLCSAHISCLHRCGCRVLLKQIFVSK